MAITYKLGIPVRGVLKHVNNIRMKVSVQNGCHKLGKKYL